MEEASVGRVADPAAGAGYVEALTDQFARAAWVRFQAIEAAGGIVAALETGFVARDTEATAAARKPPKIVGVTAFPPTEEAPVDVDPAAAADPPPTRVPGPDSQCPPLAAVRISQAFEATA